MPCDEVNKKLLKIVRNTATAIAYREEEPLRVECTAFLDAIAGRQAPPSDAAEGIRVLKVLNASRTAMESGAAVELTAEAAE